LAQIVDAGVELVGLLDGLDLLALSAKLLIFRHELLKLLGALRSGLICLGLRLPGELLLFVPELPDLVSQSQQFFFVFPQLGYLIGIRGCAFVLLGSSAQFLEFFTISPCLGKLSGLFLIG